MPPDALHSNMTGISNADNEKSLLTPLMVGLKNRPPRHEFYAHQALIDEFCHHLCGELRKYWKVFDGETVGVVCTVLLPRRLRLSHVNTCGGYGAHEGCFRWF